MRSELVLIVDDEPNIRLMLRTALVTDGYRTSEASNGREALDAVEREEPDVVLLDLSMPERDGMEVLKALKGMRLTRRPRVIVLTAYGSIAAAVKATRLGAMDFLEKPVSPAEVRDAIAAALAEPAAPGGPKADELSGGYEAVLTRVRKALRAAKLTDAESLMMKAADLAEKDAPYFNLLGVLYEVQGKELLARKCYGKSIASDRHYEPAQHNMRRLFELRQFGRAREAIELGDEEDLWAAVSSKK